MSWSEKLSIRIAKKIIPEGAAFTVGQVSHGIELFMLYLLTALTLGIISFLLGCFTEALLIAGMYMLFRNFTGGVHLKSSLSCFIAGNVLILGAAMLAQQLTGENSLFSALLVLLSAVVSFLINLRYAPAQHTYVKIEEQIARKNKRIILILIVSGCAICQILIYLGYNQLGHSYSLAVLLQSFLLHPLAYQAVRRIEKHFQERVE